MPMPFQRYRHTPPSTFPTGAARLGRRPCADLVLDRPPRRNQALVNPMDAPRKRRFLDLLVRLGVKEIEVGFPAASKADFDFCRALVEEELVPDDTTIAVLTQARPSSSSAPSRRSRVRRARSSTSTTRPRRHSAASSSVSTATGSLSWPFAGPSSAAPSPAAPARDRLPVLPRELPPHRARLRARDLRGGRRRVGPDAGGEDDRQPPDDRRSVSSERLRRSDGVVHPPLLAARQRDSLDPPAQRPGTAVATAELGLMAEPSASRAASSGTASAPATSTWSRWR